ncbi:MAG: hypothetical protein JWN35_824 [Frankiales bacterium]|jgi:hypothetical protein|nr:hypothetical protein [Frankiales bacterium]
MRRIMHVSATRTSVTAVIGVASAGYLLGVPLSPAQADPGDPYVQIYGGVDCTLNAGEVPAKSVRIRAQNGEVQQAKVIEKGYWYTADFFKVPAGGETAVASVTCAGGPAGVPRTWSRTIRVSRPDLGSMQYVGLPRKP